MTTEQKLGRIKAKCEEIIRLGEKRTQGRWEQCGEGVACDNGGFMHTACDPSDSAFISALAGPAEANARCTIAAIDGLKLSCCQKCDGSGVINHGGSGEGEENLEYCEANCQGIFDEAHKALAAILSAWPDELL